MVAAPTPASDHAAVAPLVAARRQPVRARAVPRADAGVQGRGDAAARRALMDHVLRRARRSALTIVGATSGDTGAAAIEAFRGRDEVDVFILYPHGRVSEVQRRQMTTALEANVHAIAIEGTFDDCQAIAEGAVQRPAFRDERRLAGVNSINWARVAGADRLLFHRRRGAWRAAAEGHLRRADRQFRRHLRRLRRQAHGAADRAAGDRHQRQRHSRPHAGDRRATRCAA